MIFPLNILIVHSYVSLPEAMWGYNRRVHGINFIISVNESFGARHSCTVMAIYELQLYNWLYLGLSWIIYSMNGVLLVLTVELV